MKKTYAPGELFRHCLSATLKNTRFVKGQDLIDPNQPNIFHYEPLILFQFNKYESSANYDMSVVHNYWSDALDEIKQANHLSDKTIANLRYSMEPFEFEPSIFGLDLETRMFDDQSKLLMEYDTTGFKFNKPMPNKAYGGVYTPEGRSHWSGITLPFPKLKNGKTYYLEIIERYKLSIANLLKHYVSAPVDTSNLDIPEYREFTRKISVPIVIDHKTRPYYFKWDIPESDDKNVKFDTVSKYLLAYCPNITIENVDISYLIDKIENNNHDFSAIGEQSIILQPTNMPKLIFDPDVGVMDDFCGTLDVLINGFENAAGLMNRQMAPAFRKVITEICGKDKSCIDFYACVSGAKFDFNDEVNHAGMNNTLINIANLLNKDAHPRYINMIGGTRHYSQYDFEEKLPKFIVK